MAPQRTPLPGSPDLRGAGLRRTPQREAILQVLEGAGGPLTVEEIRGRMTGRRPGIPTVYRNLQRFVQEGWAEALVGPDQVLRFVRCHSRHHHHHLVCEGCGRSVEVEACGILGGLAAIEEQTGFRVTRHLLQLFGRCLACRTRP